MKNIILMLLLHEILSISAKYSAIKPTAYLGQDLETDQDHDIVIYIGDFIGNSSITSPIDISIKKAIDAFQKFDKNVLKQITIVPLLGHPSNRLIYSPIGNIKENAHIADSRCISEAAKAGMEKAINIGSRKPLLLIGSDIPSTTKWAQEPWVTLNAVMGAYQALYVPIEIREAFPNKSHRIDHFGVRVKNESLLRIMWALEEGRRVARDIAGSDSERMTPMKISDYLETEFSLHHEIEMSSEKVDGKKYPLIEAVNRAAEQTPRHSGRVIKMEYHNDNQNKDDLDLYLIGKGITFDTGGLDLKVKNHMRSMHRDKSGAAAVAGFMKMLALLKPKGLNVHAKMPFVRNSIGSKGYATEEIVTARSGKRVRVTNTDAEGRMVMADMLCEAKEEAMTKSNPYLFTWATLSGNVRRVYGDSFTPVMENGVARSKGVTEALRDAGDLISEMVEICPLRKEDYSYHRGTTQYEDLIQTGSSVGRRFQAPTAFLIMASGLDKHDIDHNSTHKAIPFTHLDVASSAGKVDFVPNGTPYLMFAVKYILPRV